MFSKYSAVKSLFLSDLILQKFVCGSRRHEENVVEIIDNETAEGNKLLNNILVNCILPQTHGGNSVCAFYFDLNQHFDFLSIVSVMEEKSKADESEIRDWMKKFHLVRCADMEQVLITLHSIESLIANSKIPVKLIIVDGLSASHWNEQCASSQYFKEQNYRRIVKVLDSFMKKYNLSVIVRSLEVFGRKRSENGVLCLDPRNLRLYGDFWKDFVTHRFVLENSFHNNNPVKEAVPSNFALRCLSPESYSVDFVITDGGVVK